MSASTMLSECACGASTLRISLPPPESSSSSSSSSSSLSQDHQLFDCHCSDCRRFHTAAFVRYLRLPSLDSVEVNGSTTVVHDHCREFGAVDRIVCQACSSKLATRTTASGDHPTATTMMINMGPVLDDTVPSTVLQLQAQQLQVSETASWTWARPTLETPPTTSTSSHPLTWQGRCSCGSCRYELELDDGWTELQHCYCRLCRCYSGAPFQTWLPAHSMRWMGPEPPLIRTTDHGQRHKCPVCHSVLTIVYDEQPGVIWPAVGGIVHVPPSTAARNGAACYERVLHICCRYKPNWYRLPNDGLERVQEAC